MTVDERPASEQASAELRADRELVRRSLAGETRAIGELVERARCVRRILTLKASQLRLSLDAGDLEDLVQDTLVAIWRRLGDYEGRGPLEAWMYRFCHFTLLAHVRNARRDSARRAEIGEEEEPSEEAPLAPETHEAVYRALEQVGPPDADVIRGKHFEALTFDELAARSGASINTVKSRYYRGLRKVREILGQGEART